MTSTFLPELDLKKVRKHPKNPRQRAVADTEMVESIAANGLLQPLVVAPDPDKVDGYILIAGHRRLDGCKKARLKTAPAMLRTDLVTEIQQVEQMLVENVHRSDLTPIEEAEGYHQLELLGCKPAAIAAAVGRDVKTVRARLKLLKLAASTRKKVNAGQLSLEDAAAIGEFSDDPALTERLEKMAGDGYGFKQELILARRRRNAARENAAMVAKLLDAGAIQLDVADDTSVYSWLREKGCERLEQTHSTDWGQHKKCKGLAFAAYTYYRDPQLVIVCTNPGLHAGQIESQRSAEDKARRAENEAREKEREERSLAYAAASDVRVADVLTSIEGAVLPSALVDLVRVALPSILKTFDRGERETYFDIVGITAPDRWLDIQWGQVARKQQVLFEQHLDDLAAGTAALVTKALAGVLVASAEAHLPGTGYSQFPRIAADYWTLLDHIGHEPGDIDAELRSQLELTQEKAS